MNNNLITWSAVAALAGFIFGFDTVVISGANLPIKELWQTSPWFHGFFIMSMALWGTVAGSLSGGVLTERYGRKRILQWIGILFSLSAIGTALATDPYTFSFFRFMGGVGIGVSSVTVPAYIAEISTTKIRGRLVAMYQFNIVFGILIAFLSNYYLKGFDGANDWRWMMGILIVPSLLYSAMVWRVPESPRWLITKKQDEHRARSIMQQAGFSDADAAIKEMMQQHAMSGKHNEHIFSPKYRKVLSLAFFIAFFNQLSGINFILYYAPEILERAGVAAKDSLFNSVAIGGVNLLFTFAGLYLIDRMGRRMLIMIGSAGYIISLAAVAYAFKTGAGSTFLMVFLLLFIAAHAIGQGAVIWVYISEIFPNRVRAVGQSFGAATHWIFAALIALVTPVFLDAKSGILRNAPWVIFVFFAVMMLLQLVWALTKMPETKGVSLEKLEQQLLKE
ncbi:MAG: sugar porter family MFS transporter [Dinghuibacter sp.]|nr:sugar porter family MFS transporter [Dinghuibacter sp.]